MGDEANPSFNERGRENLVGNGFRIEGGRNSYGSGGNEYSVKSGLVLVERGYALNPERLCSHVLVQQLGTYHHPNENLAMSLVSPLLDSTNYHFWNRSMITALSAKNKVELTDGSAPRPLAFDRLFGAWKRCNTMVRKFGAISSRGTRKLEASSLKQGDFTVTDYFTQLRVFWDELENFRPYPFCYANVHSHVLLMDLLPPINKIFSYVAQQERQYSIPDIFHPETKQNSINVVNALPPLLPLVPFMDDMVTLRVLVIANMASQIILILLMEKFVHIVGRQVIQLKFAIRSMNIFLVIVSLMPNPFLLAVSHSLKQQLLKRNNILVLRIQKFGLLLNNIKLYWP
ncbi:hypothetical protein V8G54_022054 [Vigna mungo]|uniref:Retrotransposon Copia-like N-terminal domain-containing protein n=1 Tax=Vigna mungo TaxID=3915 RepID=A0AAQ3N9I1_VIGMU